MENQLIIVMYHYVRNLATSRYSQIKGLDLPQFEEQLYFFNKNYNVIKIEDILERKRIGKELPPNALLLTFDDGYIDHYTNCFPLLQQHGLQGTFFVSPQTFIENKVLDVNKIHLLLSTISIDELNNELFNQIDQYRKTFQIDHTNGEFFEKYAVPNRYDNKEIIFFKRMLQKVLPTEIRKDILDFLFKQYMDISEDVLAQEMYMNLSQIKTMKKDGMYFGIHGYSHMWMTHLKGEELSEEIEKSLIAMETVIDKNNWIISYPYGAFTRDTINIVQKQGCKLGVSIEPRVINLDNEDIFSLPRFDTNDFPPKSKKYIKCFV